MRKTGKNFLFDMGPENASIAEHFVQVTKSTLYSPTNGYGWTKAPEQSFDSLQLKRSNSLTQDGLLVADSVIYKVDVPQGEYFLAVTLGNTNGIGSSMAAIVKVNQEVIYDSIYQVLSQLHYSTFRKRIVIKQDYAEIKIISGSREVGLYGIELRPVISDFRPVAIAGGLEQDTSEVKTLARKLALELSENPEDIDLVNQLDMVNKYLTAAYYYDIGWWSWAVEATGLSIFDRYNIASDLLRQVIADPRDPLHDRATYLLGRIHFWLYKEQHEDFDRHEYQKFLNLIGPDYPEHKILGMYLGEKIPNPASCKSDVQNAPLWANLQREAICRMLNIIHWWVDNVQAENGEFGGKFGDDVEMLRWWLPTILGVDDEKARQGYTKLVEGVWNSGRLYRGYSKKVSDVEHAAELFRDTHPAMLMMDYGNPVYVERCMISMQNFRDVWTGITPMGHRHFKSCYFSATEVVEEPPFSVDVPMNARAALPGLWVAWYNHHPTILQLFSEWGNAWVEDADRTDLGKPAGILPAAITFSNDKVGGYSDNWYHPNLGWEYYKWENLGGNIEMYNQLLGMHSITGDSSFLRPVNMTYELIEDSKISKGTGMIEAGSAAWVARHLTGKNANDDVFDSRMAGMFGLAKRLTGNSRYDSFVKVAGQPYSRFLTTGNKDELHKGLGRMLASLNYNFPLFTSEVKFTDRVYIPERELLFGMYTGHIGSGFEYPSMAVTWKNTGKNISILVNAATKKTLEISLYNFGNDQTVTMETWQLESGRYVLKTGLDDNGNGVIDKNAENTEFEIHDRMSRMDVAIPSGKPFLISIQQLEPFSEPIFSMSDPALSKDNFLISNVHPETGETVQINARVHNIGNVSAKDVKVDFLIDEKIIHSQQIPLISAPHDLVPKWETVSTHWVAEKGVHRIGAKISITENEITGYNNEVSSTVTVK